MNLLELTKKILTGRSEVSKNFIWRLVQILSKQGCSALMFFIATTILSKQDMGIYNYISSVLFLLVTFSDFGISTATSKFVTQYNLESKGKVKRVFFNSSLVIFLISLLLILVVLIFGEGIFSEQSKYVYYVLPLVFIYPTTSLLDGIYRGLKKFKLLATISIILGVSGVFLSYILVNSYGLIGAILNQVIFFTVYSLTLFFFNKEYEFKLDKKILKDVSVYSTYFGIASLGYYLFSKVNTLILGGKNLFEEIAVYELLNKIYAIYLIPFTVLGQVLAPEVVEMFSMKKFENVRDLFRKLLVGSLCLIALFVPVSFLLTKIGVEIFFPSYWNEVLLSLIFPVAFTTAKAIPVVIINSALITSTGHAKYMAIENIVVGILNVILNSFVVEKYGYVGVVWVTLILQTISLFVLYLVYYRKLKEYKG